MQDGLLTESYMIEVLSSELLLKSYQAYTKWVADHRELHVARLYFLGSVAGESGSSEKKLNDRLQLENLPVLLWDAAGETARTAWRKRRISLCGLRT